MKMLVAVHKVDSSDRRLVSYADVDWANNRVQVYASKVTEELRGALRRQFGAGAPVRQGPEINAEGRLNDVSPFWGGALYGMRRDMASPVEFICSTGFSYRSATGAAQMLTAGHCMATNSPRPVAATPYSTDFGYELGRRAASSYRDGDGSIAVNGRQVGDISVLNIAAGKTSAPYLYVGGVNPGSAMILRGVNNTTSTSGGSYNVSGQTTGETTGWSVKSGTSSYTDGRTGDVVAPVVRGGKQGPCTNNGDSGGPTYTVSGGVAYALGIHSGGGGGGDDKFGGALDPCVEFYSRVQNAPAAFGGKVIVSP